MSRKIFFIPARAGSKRVPGKNYKLLNSKPLITYSIDFALSVATSKDLIVVSTDCPHVLSIANVYSDKLLIHHRDSRFADDSSTMIDVVTNFLSIFSTYDPSDILVLLQPTTPFRDVTTYDLLCQAYYTLPDRSSSLSVIDTEFFHPSKVGKLLPNHHFIHAIDNLQDNVDNNKKTPYYVISGSFYLLNIASLLKHKSFIGPYPSAVVEPTDSFVNIDFPRDFIVAEFIAQQKI